MDTDATNEQPGSWIILTNDSKTEKLLEIEPYAVGWYMQPGESFTVYVCEDNRYLPVISFGETGISVFASRSVVYRGDEQIFNYYDQDIPLPKQLKP